MTDPTERLEHFATNDESRGGDLLSEADCESLPDPAMLAVRSYLSAVKRFGLALQQLGRRCDE